MPLHDAAEAIWTVRFRAVLDLWQPAIEASTDPEPVHQLRVATRRASASLRTFGDLLPPTKVTQLRRHLKKTRRAAGDARDWDVLALRLFHWAETRSSAEQAGLDLLAGLALDRRRKAQNALNRSIKRQPSFRKLTSNLKARGAKRQALQDRARQMLPELIAEFERRAALPLTEANNLHQLRIAGKRLRYALELFIDCYPQQTHSSFYTVLEQVQDILGAANDARVLIKRMDTVLIVLRRFPDTVAERFRPGIEAWRQHLINEVADGPARFRAWKPTWEAAAESVEWDRPSNATAEPE